jgi:hypothetical protein
MQLSDASASDASIQAAIDKTRWSPGDGTPVAWRRCSLADFPADPTFRNAWRDDGTSVRVDMPAARTIWREHLRVLRKPLLEALDVEHLRADERGDKAEKARIAEKKQALRDVTADPRIDAAGTPEELKAVVLEPLLSRTATPEVRAGR